MQGFSIWKPCSPTTIISYQILVFPLHPRHFLNDMSNDQLTVIPIQRAQLFPEARLGSNQNINSAGDGGTARLHNIAASRNMKEKWDWKEAATEEIMHASSFSFPPQIAAHSFQYDSESNSKPARPKPLRAQHALVCPISFCAWLT